MDEILFWKVEPRLSLKRLQKIIKRELKNRFLKLRLEIQTRYTVLATETFA